MVALERDNPILTGREFANQDKHRLTSSPQHLYDSIANGMQAHPSYWHLSHLHCAYMFSLPVLLIPPSHSLLTKRMSLVEI